MIKLKNYTKSTISYFTENLLRNNKTLSIIAVILVTALLYPVMTMNCIAEPQIFIEVEGEQNTGGLPKKSPYFTFVSEFGDEKSGTKGDFLLVSPGQIKVKENGDIFLSDEVKIKVYDKNGRGKLILGRKGQGPGEFKDNPPTFLSPAGYITAYCSTNMDPAYYNVYNPLYKLLYKKHFEMIPEALKYLKGKNVPEDAHYQVWDVMAIDEKRRIYRVSISELNDINIREYSLIAYEEEKSFVPISFLKFDDKYIRYKNYIYISPNLLSNSCSFVYLQGNKVLYTSDTENTFISDTLANKIIHIFDIDKKLDEKMTISFSPRKFTEKDINFFEKTARDQVKGRGGSNRDADVFGEMVRKTAEKRKYDNSISESDMFKCDGKYVFISIDQRIILAFSAYAEDGKNVFISIVQQVFIIDMETKKVVSVIPNLFQGDTPYIRNGLLYYKETNQEGYDVVRIYKLNPSVYGK